MNILIVDQTDVVCSFLSEELEIIDASITTTTSLVEGSELIQKKSYDVLIAGASSKDGSTLDFIKSIRNKYGSKILIIVMSSYPPNTINEYIENGANYYLNKRLGMIHLLKEITTSIESFYK